MKFLNDGTLGPFAASADSKHRFYDIDLPLPREDADPEQIMDFATIAGLCYGMQSPGGKVIADRAMAVYMKRWVGDE